VTVVSDSSPLIALARIGKLSILAELYGRILIPAEVHHEVTVAGRGLPGSEEGRRAHWIELAKPDRDDPALARACDGLGAGERAAILLAKTLPADLTLLDEWKASRVAQEASLLVLGCLGVLEAAARKGLIRDLRECYLELLRQGIRFGLRLLQESLIRLGLPKL
jgi:predicted nucleic acid-binding protein